jgi:Tfp pilus assembly protein PilZ
MLENQKDNSKAENGHGRGHDLVIKNVAAFSTMLDEKIVDGGLFYPTRQRLDPGVLVALRVRLGRRQAPMIVYGTVLWRRPGRHKEGIRAGLGVGIIDTEQSKVRYLLDLVRSGPTAKSRRRHERVPVDLPVQWRREDQRIDLEGRLCDVGQGGAFIRSRPPSENCAHVVLSIAAPGGIVPMAVTARVAWIDTSGPEPGFGVEWRARDAGGGRRIRELVRRLTRVHRTVPLSFSAV